MPTKPIQSFVFATGVNYAVGPQAGNPTKIVPGDTINGLVPGDGVPAAWMNYMWNICGQWSGWLLAGSPLAGLDAHLVETDATGKAELAMLELGGTAAGAIALVVICTLLAVGLLAAFIFYAVRRRQKNAVRTQASDLDWRMAARGGRKGQRGAFGGLEERLNDDDL